MKDFYPFPDKYFEIQKPWGGSSLTGVSGIGELFLICDLENQKSLFNGKSLKDLRDIYGPEFLGKSIEDKYQGFFPVYLKELDAIDNLSVQVHPDDTLAKQLESENFGKSEFWYIVDAQKGSGIYLGFKQGVTADQLSQTIKDNNDVSSLLNFIEVKSGDSFLIPAGLVHAIGKGVRLLEPQQNSNTTYRVWDWNRIDNQGNPRELHIEKSLKALKFDTDFNLKYAKPGVPTGNIIVDSKYFKVEKFDKRQVLDSVSSYRILVSVSGTFKLLDRYTIDNKNKAALIPAFMKDIEINGVSEECEYLVITPK